MIDYLEKLRKEQIEQINLFYDVTTAIVECTTSYFNVEPQFNHCMAKVIWSFDDYDIWLVSEFFKEEPDCLLNIVVFNNKKDGDSLDLILSVTKKDKFVVKVCGALCEDKLFKEYIEKLGSLVGSM